MTDADFAYLMLSLGTMAVFSAVLWYASAVAPDRDKIKR